MVQMPLPQDIRDKTFDIVSAIAAEKDVDGLAGKGRFLPATVKAILDILGEMKVDVAGRKVVVVGRSAIVGRPLAEELVRRGAQMTVAHSQTPDLGAVTRKAEILISATGKPNLIKKDMVKPEAIVIDVGEPKGDVAHDVRKVASWITPVPGGVGPVTVACLMENVVECSYHTHPVRVP
jgi:methylenetetrahydrofolate dehydrogenase (NADP+)/methenyltetrahydrofolate cyclohydrolase